MNLTDYDGPDNCYRLPMVYVDFVLPQSTTSRYIPSQAIARRAAVLI
jgi:hypothetical protein